MNVYFHIDELARDRVVATTLKKYLAPHGINFLPGNRKLTSFISRFPVAYDVSVFPSVDLAKCFLDGPVDPGKVVILPTESISGNGLNERRLFQHLLGVMPEAEQEIYMKRISKFLLWGHAHHKILLEHKLFDSTNKLAVVGHPRHDVTSLGSTKRNITGKLRVGLVSRFDLLNIFDDRSNLESIFAARKVPGQPLAYFQEESKTDADRWYNAVSDLLVFFEVIDRCQNMRGIEILVRPHPRENASGWSSLISKFSLNVKLTDPVQPFIEWLKDLDVVVSTASTSLYDCVLLKKPVLLIDRIDPKRLDHSSVFQDDFDPIFNFINRPKSMDDLVGTLTGMIEAGNVKGLVADTSKSELRRLLSDEVGFPNQKFSLKSASEELRGLRPVAPSFFRSNVNVTIHRLAVYLMRSLFWLINIKQPVSSSNFKPLRCRDV